MVDTLLDRNAMNAESTTFHMLPYAPMSALAKTVIAATSDSSNVMAGNTRPGHLLSIFESLICNMMKPMQMAMRNTKNTTANIVAPIMITLLA